MTHRSDAPATPADSTTLDPRVYGRYMRLLEVLGGRTDVRLHVAQDGNALEDGDIFLFNHFTRFETVVPPYIIFRKTGRMCRSVAHHGLFEVNDALARVLRETGGIPNNTPRLLPYLAEEILRGRKVVIFPEGGMVKDKNVMDGRGRYSVFSPTQGVSRPHHRGAAVLALMVDMIKLRLRDLMARGDQAGLAHWCGQLGLDEAALRRAAAKPTLIVPGNITFYPIRTDENVLSRALALLVRDAPAQAVDELRIEGNMLLHDTDMHLRFGLPVPALAGRPPLRERALLRALRHTHSTDEVFALHGGGRSLLRRHAKALIEFEVDRIRTEYAHRIYRETTLNLNHLVAVLVTLLAEQGRMEVPCRTFHTALYLALKTLQNDPRAHLHPTLLRPSLYAGLTEGAPRGLRGFVAACARARLLRRQGEVYRLSHRLRDPQDFHEVRLENPVRIHANEAAPVPAVRRAVELALAQADSVAPATLALHRFDDELREFNGQRYKWSRLAPDSVINSAQPQACAPYLLLPPAGHAATGVLLTHGFGTHPAELRAFAESLHAQGHAVLGVRLPGHGTSYYDMEQRTRHEWLEAVRRNHAILAPLADTVVAVGFSTGAALSLMLAAENPPKLAGVASVAAPWHVHDKNMRWLPYVTPLHHLLRALGLRHLLRLYPYGTHTPDTVYRYAPVRALNQLRLLIADMTALLPRVTVPVLVLQGLSDKSVKAQSAPAIVEALGSPDKELRWIANGPHALISANHGATWEVLKAFVARFGPSAGKAR